MLYCIAELNPLSNSYYIDDTTEDWYKLVSGIEPIDIVDGKMLIFDEKGHKYAIASPKAHPPIDLAQGKRFGIVDVGTWDFTNNEPLLKDTGEEDPEELRRSLADYLHRLSKTKKGIIRKRPAFYLLRSEVNYLDYTLNKLIALAKRISSA